MSWRRPYYAVFLSLSFLFLVSGAAAQGNKTAEDTASKTVLKELDNATWITDIDWNPENSTGIKVTVYSEIPKPVRIQEIPDYTGTSGSFEPMKQVTLQSGKNIIHLPVNGRINFGVSIADSNDGAYYRKSFLDIFPEVSTPMLFFAGFVGFAVVVTGEYWYASRRTEKVEQGSGELL